MGQQWATSSHDNCRLEGRVSTLEVVKSICTCASSQLLLCVSCLPAPPFPLRPKKIKTRVEPENPARIFCLGFVFHLLEGLGTLGPVGYMPSSCWAPDPRFPS